MRAVVACLLVQQCVAYLKTSADDLASNTGYSFADYIAEYGKQYSAGEMAHRERIFLENLAKIRRHNADKTQTYRMGLNEYADWSAEEFKSMHSGVKGERPTMELASRVPQSLKDLPTSVDWRTKNAVTPVKNQAECGSCWAFSATETMESATAIATGTLPVLGPQQLVSCSPNPNDCGGTGGCKGSTQVLAYNYTITAGLTLEKDYPYTSGLGITHPCKPELIKPAIGIKGFVLLPVNNYTALMDAIANVGPVAISADAASWQLYESGIFSKNCGYVVDHGIQLVGYGQEGSEMYWIVRNSWGATWGEQGYIRIKRFGEGSEPCGMDNKPQDGLACKGDDTPVKYCGECAILSYSSYPTGAHLV
eukprot:TRINITY_DN10239_c0_g1_i1.p1 TRINITY_DN10239_c0_g1~~TRINITY_DN10239_c0_g1_i1.p1  ORF type:complete len:365 (+),score=122.61 TRINITY_DN10239_c0_g1_i1:46-1140(+)